MEISKIVLSSLLSVGALFVVTKIMGHKQISQLDFFDYVSGITIGSIGAELATELEAPHKPLVALIFYCSVSVALDMLTSKYPKTRKYVNGTPTILMCNGKLYRDNLKKAKLDLSEFLLLCREQGYFELADIETAVFEHNGRLSVLPRSASRPVTRDDMGISVKRAEIGTEIIMDGRIMGENLRRIGRDAKWLNALLRAQGYKEAKEIFLCIYHPEADSIELYSNK